MTKADRKRIAKALYMANKMQTTEDGRRAVYQVTSYIAQEIGDTNFIGEVAELILETGSKPDEFIG